MNRITLLFPENCYVIAIVIAFFSIASQANAAYVPVKEPVSEQQVVKTEPLETVYLQLAALSNKEIEKLSGKKLTLREKAGLFMLRRQISKKGAGAIRNMAGWEDKCFTMRLKNGDVLEVNLVQVGTSEIKYKRCNKPGDPEIVIAKADVYSITDSGGDVIYSSKDESWKHGMQAGSGATDRLALAAGITGIGALSIGFLVWPLGLAAGIAAGIMGLISLRRFKDNRNLRGEGWAITGIVAGGLWVFFGVLLLIAASTWWWW